MEGANRERCQTMETVHETEKRKSANRVNDSTRADSWRRRRAGVALALVLACLTGSPSGPGQLSAFDLVWFNPWIYPWDFAVFGGGFAPTGNLYAQDVRAYGTYGSSHSFKALAQTVTVTRSGTVDYVDLLLSTRGTHLARVGELRVVVYSSRQPSRSYTGGLGVSAANRQLSREWVSFQIRDYSGAKLSVNTGDVLTIELQNSQAGINPRYSWWGQWYGYEGGTAMWWFQPDRFGGYYQTSSGFDYGCRLWLK